VLDRDRAAVRRAITVVDGREREHGCEGGHEHDRCETQGDNREESLRAPAKSADAPPGQRNGDPGKNDGEDRWEDCDDDERDGDGENGRDHPSNHAPRPLEDCFHNLGIRCLAVPDKRSIGYGGRKCLRPRHRANGWILVGADPNGATPGC
jgi:hypothetical protein